MKPSRARFILIMALFCGVFLASAILLASQRGEFGPTARPMTAPSSRAAAQAVERRPSVSATVSVNGMTLAYTGPKEVTANEPVEVKLELRNDRPKEGGREVWYVFSPQVGVPIGIEVQSPSGHSVEATLWAKGKGFVWMGSENGQLLPGGRVEGTKELSKLADMAEPGEYLVSVVAGFDDPTYPNGYWTRHIRLCEIPILVVKPKADAD